ncbi:MAG: pyrimidine dimer DNA glycosylase/endonuclease V [Flaviflexus sp.]|nr:pyrimidine dimer DNA glycosylase/endonuclease V [Flaviflexus sp.]
MRLWSIHPSFLDRQGLLACWREALLAQKVLAGQTTGYRKHPQLERFAPHGLAGIGDYLRPLVAEATARGYRFDATKILCNRGIGQRLEVTEGQLALERAHLYAKLTIRHPDEAAVLPEVLHPHPMFLAVAGPVASWERATAPPVISP